MNFLGMVNVIIGRTKLQFENPVHKKLVQDWINLSRDQFVGFGPWHFLATTYTENLVNATKEYSLQSDFHQINDREVRLTTTQTPLEFLDDEKAKWVISDPTETGTPAYFRLVGYQKIQLFPIPNSAAVTAETSFEYEYYKRLTTPLSGDSDESGLPEFADVILIDLAECYAQQWANNSQAAVLAYNRFQTGLRPLWEKNNEIVGLGPRDFPAPFKVEAYEQATLASRN